ncbi:hypothetical protein XPA_010174 [Xanthoria parietina]
MDPVDVRIGQRAYIVSTAVLLGICVFSATSRFYIRLWVGKSFSIDDVFLLGAVCSLICAVVIMYSVTLDKLYQVQALSAGLPKAIDIGFMVQDLPLDPSFFRPVYQYLKWITVNQTLAWSSIMAVKFSFLFHFRKLIDRIPPLITYWWCVVAFNVIAWGYGFSTYFLVCPHYNDPKIYECSLPSGIARLLGHGIAQTVMDITGDLLILYIPVNLIWKIQIKWTQKVPLALSLCLTGVMVLVTITRIAGIRFNGQIDSVWESYFTIVAAEIGVVLASVSTYRALFVSHRKRTIDKAQDQGHSSAPKRQLMRRMFVSSPWRSKNKDRPTPNDNEEKHCSQFDGALPSIPRAHMTGVRTYINGRGQNTNTSDTMESQVIHDEHYDDDWPLRKDDGSLLGRI